MKRLAAVADRATEYAAVVVALALLAVVVLGVAFRIINDPLIWSDELARYLMVWLALLGWIVATRRRSHIRVTVILYLLPSRSRAAVEIAIQLCVLAFGAVLAWHSVELIDRAWDVEAVSLAVPSALLYLLVPFTGSVVALQAAVEIAYVLRGGRPQPAARPEIVA